MLDVNEDGRPAHLMSVRWTGSTYCITHVFGKEIHLRPGDTFEATVTLKFEKPPYQTTRERAFKSAVRGLIRTHRYPSPSAIRETLGEGGSGQRNNLNGRECKWREQVFEESGWRHTGARPRSSEKPLQRLPCRSVSPLAPIVGYICELLAGHPGQHSAPSVGHSWSSWEEACECG